MPPKTPIQIRIGSWPELKSLVIPIRTEVFVVEQKVPLEEEVDAWDPECVHALALDAKGLPAGTGRLLPDGHIGRMSVLSAYRGLGFGGEILTALTQQARLLGFSQVALNAQTHALGFYQQHGFVEEGEEFDDANIPHILMRKALR